MTENLDSEIKKTAKEIVVSKDAQKRLKAIGGWGLFLAIYGFILALVLLIQSFMQFNQISEIRKAYSSLNQFGGGFGDSMMEASIFRLKVSATIVLFIGLAMILPGFFLIRYYIFSRRSFDNNDQEDFEDSLKYLRNTFIFAACYAILTILAVALLILEVGRFL